MSLGKRKGTLFSMINLLFLGEIVGRAGIQALKNGLPALKEKYDVDYTIINAEGMTNGYGIGRMHSLQLGKLGIDLSTGGEKLFYKIDMVEHIKKAGYMLRPYNMPPDCPGRGYRIQMIKDRKFLIANLIGNSDFSKLNAQNAFLAAENLRKKAEDENAVLIVYFHAATTAEKNTMLCFLDGKAAAVVGTHTKILTADAHVTGNGTAYITDTGRVGSFMSVSGFEPDTEIKKMKGAIPIRSREAWLDGRIEGLLVSIDEQTLKAVDAITIDEKVEVKKPEEKG